MKKYLGILTLLGCLFILESCNSHIQTGWTPYSPKPAYAKNQKKSKLHRVRMGTTPLTKSNPTH
jgi:hypothetical protein